MRTTPHQSNANPLAFRLLLALVGCGADLPAAERASGPLKRKLQIHYRGAQQELPGSPTRISPREAAAYPTNARKEDKNAAPKSPNHPTGVPNKSYRGPQQKLPGSPTRVTGVPNKSYRGARQKLPGRPTSGSL